MKWLIYLSGVLVCLLMVQPAVFGQVSFVDQIHNPGIDHNEAVKKFTKKYAVGRFDVDKFLRLDEDINNQTVVHQVGDYNRANIEQIGSENTGIINMVGNDNEANLLQEGSGLLSIINMQGNNNALDFDQYGDDYGVLFNMTGDNLQYDAVTQPAGNSGRYGFRLLPKRGRGRPAIDIITTRNYLPVIINSR